MKALESAREKIRKLSARPLIFTLVLILVAAGASVVTDKTVQAIGVGNLVKANDEYLASSLKKSGVAFVTLSAIKAGVAIITGSTVGIEAVATANVEIGGGLCLLRLALYLSPCVYQKSDAGILP